MYSAGLANGTIRPTFMFPLDGCKNEFAVGDKRNLLGVKWDGVGKTATLICNTTAIEQDPIYATNSFDSGGIDPKGQLVAGSFRSAGCVRNGDPDATAYLFKKNGDIVPIIRNLSAFPGVAWYEEKKVMYYLNLCSYTIYKCDWSPKTGEISKTHTRHF